MRLLSFMVVGLIGFLVDATVLQVLVHMKVLGPVAARFVSFPLAVTVTWGLNRRFTFADRRSSPGSYLLYAIGQTLGALLNLVVYIVLIKHSESLATRPVVALAIGAVFGLTFNFLWSKAIVFARPKTNPVGN